MSTPVLARRRLRVVGVVQGVGFRPFVHRLASELGLSGFVGNDRDGVVVEVEGPEEALDELQRRLWSDAPPLSRVDAVHATVRAVRRETDFRIAGSTIGVGGRTLVPPDVAACDACLAEVDDPADRRYRYPFTNCTQCGPRFTIIRSLPYDRPATTMAGFEMCARCAAEYRDPTDRRYHAQPVACPECGPRLGFERDGGVVRGTDPVLAAVQLAVAHGAIVAIKGIGGYHLACDALNDAALSTLRERKGRIAKPLAVMVPSLDAARAIAQVDEAEAAALTSAARPIVLLARRAGAPLSELVAPGSPLVGVMLPYSPLHHLVFRPVPGGDAPVPRVLVLTSGNVSEEPICTDDQEARLRLAGLADAFCTHDRPIHAPCDDSVVRVVGGEVVPIRRSRGYAPLPVTLPVEVAPTLAVGGELKNTFCLAAGRQGWMSQHLGDMGNLETLRAFEQSVAQFTAMYGIEPEVIAVDAHPGYLTHRWAREHTDGAVLVAVQHHHAHVASAMAEHGLDGSSPVVGFAFDGTGYGHAADGRPAIWGGEVLVADYEGFDRVAHLAELPLPGGDAAVRNPCRIALAYLTACGIELDDRVPAVAACDEVERRVVLRQLERQVGYVPTSSMGRLFDVVASLLGVRHRVTYEAQAAMELEALATGWTGPPLAPSMQFDCRPDGVVDPSPVLRTLVDGVRSGTDRAGLAHQFHRAVADMMGVVATQVREHTGLGAVALSGGVFQNVLVTELARERLEAEGFQVLTHRRVPPNDGGLALGQAVIAGCRRR